MSGPERGTGVGRTQWFAALFFVGMGVLVLAFGGDRGLGWVSLVIGLLALVTFEAIRVGWLRPLSAKPRGQPTPPVNVARRAPETRVPSRAARDVDRVDRVVAVLGRAGVFAPQVPDPWDLYPAVADRGTPTTVVDVLRSLDEADHWTREFDPSRYSANLAHHETQVEQSADYLTAQAADLARLAGGTVAVDVLDVHQDIPPTGGRRTPTRIRLTVAGRPLDVAYLGTTKNLSTVLHVALSRALRTAGAPRRIAVLGDDGHLTLTGLPDQDLNVLNTELGLPPSDPSGRGGWSWMDETEPYAAGDDAKT